jgi:uncharacterized protein YqgC (DUF456 family)
MHTVAAVVAGIIIVIGVFGTIIPIVPGLFLCWCGVLVWAVFGGAGWIGWAVFAIATVLTLAGEIGKYVWPGRRLKRKGVPNLTLFAGGILGIIGFFVVPVVGLVLGFVLGIWLAEVARLRDWKAAWPSTRHALAAAGISTLIELAAAIAVTVVWVIGLVAA